MSKLLIVEVSHDLSATPETITKLLTEVWLCRVHELPAAVELGRVAHKIWMRESRDLPDTEYEFLRLIGEALLGALVRIVRPEGIPDEPQT